MTIMTIPALTAKEMARAGTIMTADLGIDVRQLMELAGRAVAVFARQRFLAGDPRDRRIVILAGSGGNGGDGRVAARLLATWGAEVEVVLSHPPAAPRSAAAQQHRIVTHLGLPLHAPPPETAAPRLPPADLLIDDLFGFRLTAAPRGHGAVLIEAANTHPAPILAVDLPSGLNATAGEPFRFCLRTAATLALALPKTGLHTPAARPVTGDIHVADIGVPDIVSTRLGHTVGPLFAAREIIPLPSAV